MLSMGTLAEITNNTAVNGGGLYTPESSTATLDGTDVTGNKAQGAAVVAGGNGGGIFNSGSLTIQNGSVFDANQAVASRTPPTRSAGTAAPSSTSRSSRRQPAAFDHRTARSPAACPSVQFNASFGGGVSQYNAPMPATITNSTLTGNVGFFGGGLYASAPLTVTGSTINSNPGVVGGGVYVASPSVASPTTLTGGSLSGNTAANGGGIYIVGNGSAPNPGTAVLDGVTMNDNLVDGGTTSTTAGNGGGAFNAGALTIRNSNSHRQPGQGRNSRRRSDRLRRRGLHRTGRRR